MKYSGTACPPADTLAALRSTWPVTSFNCESRRLSAVGQDTLGDEILEVARDKAANVEFVSRARVGLPTETVIAIVDAMGNATYKLVQPVA